MGLKTKKEKERKLNERFKIGKILKIYDNRKKTKLLCALTFITSILSLIFLIKFAPTAYLPLFLIRSTEGKFSSKGDFLFCLLIQI